MFSGRRINKRINKMRDSMNIDTQGNHHYNYEGFSADSTEANMTRLQELRRVIDDLPWARDDQISLLSIPASSNTSGFILCGAGIIGINEKLFSSHVPSEIVQNAAIHERTHLHLASDFRQAFLAHHSDVNAFFHGKIIPEWIAGVTDIADYVNQNFLIYKGYRGLLPEGYVYRDLQLDEIIAAINFYFSEVKKGLVKQDTAFGMGLSIRSMPCNEDEDTPLFANIPERSPDVLYDKDPQKFLEEVMSGFELMKELHQKYTFGLGGLIFDLEEGFTNFIACGITGISPDELQKYCRQDDWKIKLAKEILATGVDPLKALEQVKSLPELMEFCRQIGVISSLK
jgi:hypothetical protein